MRNTLRAWRSTSTAPMKTMQSRPKSAHAVAVATPCCPAPVSAMTRVLPMRRVSSACPSTLLILCEPVWVRSSRLSRTRAPPAAARRPVVSVTGVGRPAYDVSSPSSSAWKAGSASAFAHSAASWSSAATSASGTNRPPYGPKWPVGSGPAVEDVMSLGGAGPGRRVRADRHELGHRGTWVAVGDEALADEDSVGAGSRISEEVVRPAHSGLCDLHHRVGDVRHDLREQVAVHLERPQVAGVDTDDLRAGVDRAF